MRFAKVKRVLLDTVFLWSHSNASRLGAALAYYTAFAISPFLLTLIAVCGLAIGTEAAQAQVVDYARNLVSPEVAAFIESLLKASANSDQGFISIVIATLVILIGATGFVAQLEDAFDTIWKVQLNETLPWYHYVWRYWWSLTLVLSAGFLLLVSLVVSTLVSGFLTLATGFLSVGILVEIFHLITSWFVISILFTLMLKFIPHVIVPWRIVIRGGMFTSLLFSIGKIALGIYLGKAAITSPYGAAGALVAFLVWTYYSTQILLLGVSFTVIEGKDEGDKITPEEGYRWI